MVKDQEHVVFNTYGLYVTRPPWSGALDPDKAYPLDTPEGRQACGASPPAVAHLTQTHVATLPDGTTVNLPAGTILREANASPPEAEPALPPVTITCLCRPDVSLAGEVRGIRPNHRCTVHGS